MHGCFGGIHDFRDTSDTHCSWIQLDNEEAEEHLSASF